MKSNFDKLTEYFVSRKYTILIICYLVLGCFFVSFEYANREYFDIFLGTLTNEKFTIIFLLPSFLALFHNLFNFLDCRYEIILRLKSRKKYVSYHLLFLLKVTLFFFLITLLILGIFCNFVPKSGNGLSFYSQYNVHYIYLILLSVVRVLITLFLLGLLHYIFSMKFENQFYSLLIMSIYILFLEFTRVFYVDGILAFFNPGFHAFGLELSNDIIFCVVSDFVYSICCFAICIFFSYKIGKKNNIGIRK